MGMTNKQKGQLGEDIAVKFLRDREYEILRTNYRTRRAEIDIIARNNDYIVFIEVKYRESISYGYPLESVTVSKCAKIRHAAEYYILSEYGYELDVRFDVIEILNQGGLEINHLEGVF